MIKAKHNRLYSWFFFDFFFGIRFKFQFRKMTIISDLKMPNEQSVLLLQNHYSWYDGYWSYIICKNVLKRKFHAMMLKEQLKKRMFLNKCGVFSVKKNSRDALDSINYSKELLKTPENLVTIYPTGQFLTLHQQKMKFQKGIGRIIIGNSNHIAIILVVTLVDIFGFPRPEVRIYLENYIGERTLEAIEKAYQSFYQECVNKQTE